MTKQHPRETGRGAPNGETVSKQQLGCRRRFKASFTAVFYTAAVTLVIVYLSAFSPNQIASSIETEEQRRRLDDEGILPPIASGDNSDYSCDHLYKHTTNQDRTEQCNYAKTCNDGDGIFVPIVFCSDRYSTKTLSIILSPFLILALVVLFRVLGSTAEEFFSPGLEMFSLKMGLPPRFAGVTLLALGNGAPDIASTANAIMNDTKLGYLMALGELTGAGMFISTVIVGVVIVIAGSVPCKGALIRDVIMFMITLAVVYVEFSKGVIGTKAVGSFVALYFAYVCVVLAADIYHRQVVKPRLDRQRREKTPPTLDSYIVQEKGIDEEASTEDEEDIEAQETTLLKTSEKGIVKQNGSITDESSPTRKDRSISIGSYELAHPTHNDAIVQRDRGGSISSYELARPSTSSNGHHNIGNFESMIEALSNYDIGDDNSQNGLGGWAKSDEDGTEPLVVFHPHHGGVRNLSIRRTISQAEAKTSCPRPMSFDESAGEVIIADDWGEAWSTAREEFFQHWCDFTRDIYHNEENGLLVKFLLTCELPFTILRKFSIPIPCEEYYCRPLVALSIAFSPLWMWFYLLNQYDLDIFAVGGWPYHFALFFIPLLIALFIIRLAPCGQGPMPLAVTVPITLYGFVLSATWLDLIADQLVSLLSFYGIICRIPSTIMGLTVLACGNSLQDMLADVTVAKKGLANMAITACFAGPIFNMLVGLGIGFVALNKKTGIDEMDVELTPTLIPGFFFSMLNCVTVIITGVCFGGGRIRREYGYLALLLYTAYVIVSLTV